MMDLTLTLNILSKLSGVASRKGASEAYAALFTSRWMGVIFLTASRASLQFPRSTQMMLILGHCSFRDSRLARVLLSANTSAPISASLRAVARPIPAPAPVTSARRPENFPMVAVATKRHVLLPRVGAGRCVMMRICFHSATPGQGDQISEAGLC